MSNFIADYQFLVFKWNYYKKKIRREKNKKRLCDPQKLFKKTSWHNYIYSKDMENKSANPRPTTNENFHI